MSMIVKSSGKQILFRSSPTKYLLFSIFILLTGCASDSNLAKIREFATNANAAKQQLPVISGDFYPSCLRAARYFAVDILPSNNQSAVLSKVTAVEIEALSEEIAALEKRIEANPVLGSQVKLLRQLKDRLDALVQNEPSGDIAEPNFLQARVDAQKACNETKQFSGVETPQVPSLYLSSLMENGNGVIVNYLLKMGELAGADIVNFNPQFNSLKASSTTLSNQLINLFETATDDRAVITERVTAGLNLAEFIVTQIFEGRRRKTLKEAITQSNESLKKYAEGLQSIVRRVYIDQYLKTEESFLDQYYIEYISAVLDSNERKKGNSVLALTELLISIDNDRWNPEKARIQERRNLGFQYIKLLETIIDGHQELADLYRSGKKPSTQAVETLMDESNVALKEFVEKAKVLKKADANVRY